LAIGSAVLGVALLLAPTIRGEAKNVTLTQKWSGSVADEGLQKGAPENSCITNAKKFAKLWKAWKIGDKMPKVDFKKEMLILAVTSGSRLDLSARLSDKGDLQILGIATADFGPGFRYVVGVVSRDGVKTVDGKQLPKD
jgi:hypothetical protein